ncbi:MAG: MG2 domain-containing protein [Chitinophagaceae bacterium]
MKLFKKLAVALAAVVVLHACSSDKVQLEYTNAQGEVPQLTNFEFRFSKSLMPDSLLNRWDSIEYISFSPEIPGKFRWEYPDKLVFSPAKPLLAATNYKATINNALLKFSKFNGVKKAEVAFHTAPLQLVNSSVMWVGSSADTRNAQPQADLYFNYPVDMGMLKDHLKIEVEGKPQDYSIATMSNDDKVSIRLIGFKAEDKDYTGKISILKGMVPAGGKNPTEADIYEKIFVASPYKLIINDAQSNHDGSSGTIHVKCSQEVVESTIANAVSFTPAVKFTTELMDDGFSISSDQFDVTRTYELNIGKGLRGKIGGVMQDIYTTNIGFGKLEPSISFVNSKGVYLSSKGAKNIEVKIVNVEKVKVVISRIYENNILASERYGYDPKEKSGNDNGGDNYEGDYNEYGSGEMVLGDVIMEKEIDTRTLPKYGNSRLFHFDMADQLPAFKGIYHIKLRSTSEYWVSDSRFVSQSDIGLIAREGKDKVVVFANSIKTAQPASAVTINVYGNNNQLLGIGTTNGQGIAEVPIVKNALAGFSPAMVIAKTKEDFNYLPFSTTKVGTSRFDVGGKRSNSTGLDAFIYGERDIYRPGETMHAAVIVRDKLWKPVPDVPVKMKFVLPNGKELATVRKTLNSEGSAEASVPLSASAITGSYTLEVYTGNDVLLATKNLMIEEFLPDRIKVNTKLDKPFLLPGQTTNLNVNALNFFGPPAANRNYELEIQLAQKAFNSQKYERYNFSLANQNTFFDKVTRQGKTDPNGNAIESYTVPDMYQNIGILQAKFYTTVFDETGRPVNRAQSLDIFTQDWFAGIAEDGYGYYPLNQVIKFPLIALNKDDKLVPNAKVNVNVIKHEYRTVLTKSGDYFRYESQKEDKVVSIASVVLNGDGSYFPFLPTKPGNYEIRVSKEGANNYVSKDFYSYGYWGNNNDAAFEVNTEGHVDIEVDKTSYNTGDNAKVLFKTPFNGRMLVTTETDHVISYQYLDAINRSASMDLKIAKEHLPNVYITATLFKPHEVSDMPLTVANGYKSLKVDEASRKIDVQITAQKTVRSRTHQKVTVKASAGAMVTLAAVDNGVLQVSDYKTPDPYDFFYQKRALEVNGYNIYPLLFPEIRGKMSSTGGDGYDLEKRVNPIRNNRVKLMSYWSGISQANSSGEASFEFDIPQFSGEIRLMAVAAKDCDFGGKDATMTVADPIVLSTALPRFISPGDTVSVPVTITNTTNKSTTASAKFSAGLPLQVAGTSTQTVNIAANSEAQVIFKLFAGAAIQASKVTVEVSGLGEKFLDETELTIRPAASLMKQNGAGFIDAGKTQTVSLGQDIFIPSTTSYSLVVGKSPAIEFGSQLQSLVEYPYGCTEQTISAAFPQLYFGDLSELMNFHKQSTVSANANVSEAIRKIKMRQLYNGAITLWDQEGSENWWATIYALHFLFEAKRAGFDVDNGLIDATTNYTINRLKSRQTIPYYYNGNLKKQIAPKEVAYSLYVLALMNKPQTSVMNYYKQNNTILSLDSKYMLSAAYALAGDKTSFKQLLPSAFAGEESVAIFGGSFYSDVRDESIALNCLIDVDPNNAQIPVMARHVGSKLKTRRYLSTQENAFGFLAMGKLAKAANQSNITASIKIGGKEIGKMDGKDVRFTSKEITSRNVEITTSGSGRLFYYWVAEGIGNGVQYVEEDKFIRVRKRFFDRNGKPLTGTTFKQNDLIIIGISLENAYSTPIENIVITDLLPAGFEIENPRTKEIPGMDWIKDATTPEALDVRDDRINFFTNLGTAKQTFYYAVRAVSPGSYKMGPVSADAMYNGEYHSYNGAGTIRVVQ